MVKRKIIEIDEDKCNGCGLCIPNCPEGALQIIDGKVRLVSDLCCDGLGACVGHCPSDAIHVVERDAVPYDERKVMENIVKNGKNTIVAHLKHLKDHGENKFLSVALNFLMEKKIKVDLEENNMMHKNSMSDNVPCGCPGSQVRVFEEGNKKVKSDNVSALRQWPVQLNLLPIHAPFFENSHLLVAADCVAFAHPNFHSDLLHGKSLVIGCPKLDDIDGYTEKLTEIFKNNKIKSVTVAIMEVPCCHGLFVAVEDAIKASGKKIPLIQEIISIDGKSR